MLGAGNGGDAEKFRAVDGWDGIVCTVDDDLLYPPDYVERLVDGLERHPGRLVSFHGGTTRGWNGAHSAASRTKIRCLGELARDDRGVNVVGTGTLAYDARRTPIWRAVFRSANMADVHLATHARALGLPMAVLAHEAGWLTDICPPGPNIYGSNRAGDGSALDTRAQRRAELERVDWYAEPERPHVRVSIATCERPHLLAELFDDLEREAGWTSLEVAVFEDPGAADYGELVRRARSNGWAWHRMHRRMGKSGHYRLVDAELAGCRKTDANWFIFLPDDVRLVRYALPMAVTTWQRLEDPTALTLWRLRDHEGRPNWTGRRPVDRGDAFEVFHIDGLYLCRRELLEFFGYRCPRVRPRPAATPASSSGVGRAMSLRLHGAGKRLYRVKRSLAIPVAGEPSVMNPDVADRLYPDVAL